MSRVVSLAGGSPWGFTLSGGRDFGSHLKIMKLTPGGKAVRGGVQEGDFILAINDTSTEGLSHHQAQQLVKSAGATLNLKLTKEQPKVAAVVMQATFHSAPPAATGSSGERPRPPPPPSSTSAAPPPAPAAAPSQPQKTTITKSAVPQMPKAAPSQIVPSSGLETGAQSSQQSPSFNKITVEAPSKLGPPVPPPPQDDVTHQMKNVVIDDGGVRKTSQRPGPPSSSPSTFSTTSMKIASNTGPKTAPFNKPAPPPTVQSAQPPPASPNTTATPTKATSRQGVCEKCHEPIRGPYASAMGKVWHTEHFICSSCNQTLSSGTFVFEDDDIYCEECYEKKVAKTCFKCHQAIVGPTVSAADHFYHHQCFLCAKCNVNLTSQEGFNMDNNQLFCKNCFDQSYGTTCHGCHNNIGANDLWVEALDHNWHPQCFVCTTCRRSLEGGRFFAKFDQPYCSSCA